MLSRVDVALNMSNQDVTKVELLRHLMLKWRRAGTMNDDYQAGTYWCAFRDGERPPPRDLVLYDDRPDKITGELDCVHLELRLRRSRVIRNNGLLTHLPM